MSTETLIYKRQVGAQEGWRELAAAKLVRVDQRGETGKIMYEPPRKRGLVIAITNKGHITIAFPYGNTEGNGYHDNSEAYLIRTLGPNNLRFLLHGFVGQRINDENKRERTVTVFQMPKSDQELIPDVCSNLASYEEGLINPQKAFSGPDFIPERIMQALAADELNIVEGISSVSLYKLTKGGDIYGKRTKT